ncbi:MAG TPA: cytochrome c [Thermoanaerobaculia bacterium]|nr:cytochrome c [Thermoanaerobaculia bacterium]
MRVPVPVKLLGLVLGSTLFYTWVGRMVPQKEVLAPEVVEMAADMPTEEMVEVGQEIFNGKGLCNTCHTIGSSGALRFPDLDGIATTAAARIDGLDALAYLAQSIYEPDAYIVPGFSPGMPAIDKPPIALSDDEIKAVVAYLQTLGGEATITMATQLPFAAGAEVTSDVDPPGGEDATAELTGDAGVGTAAATTLTPAGAAGGGGAGLLARYGCTACHATEPGGEETLAGVGSRLSRQEIRRWLIDHEPPLPATYVERVTLAEVRSLTDYLASLEEAQ